MNKIIKYTVSIIFPIALLILLNVMNELLPNEFMDFYSDPHTFILVYVTIIYFISRKEQQ